MPITFTEDGAAVLLDAPTSLQVVISNEGNVEIYDVVVLVLVTDEYSETIYEFQTKINSIGPKESKIFLSDTINIEKGVVHEWFVKIEEIEKEEELTDNLLSVFGFSMHFIKLLVQFLPFLHCILDFHYHFKCIIL